VTDVPCELGEFLILQARNRGLTFAVHYSNRDPFQFAEGATVSKPGPYCLGYLQSYSHTETRSLSAVLSVQASGFKRPEVLHCIFNERLDQDGCGERSRTGVSRYLGLRKLRFEAQSPPISKIRAIFSDKGWSCGRLAEIPKISDGFNTMPRVRKFWSMTPYGGVFRALKMRLICL